MKAKNEFLRTLGGEWFLNTPSLLILTPYLIIASVISNVIQINGTGGQPEQTWTLAIMLLVSNALSLLLCWLMVEVLNRTLLRNKSQTPVPVVVVLAISFALGAAKGLTTGGFGLLLGAFDSFEFAITERWLQTGLLGLASLPLLTLTSAKIASLNQTRELLVSERVSALLNDPMHVDQNLEDRVRRLQLQLGDAVVELERQVGDDRVANQVLLEKGIKELIDIKIRPLSHELWKEQEVLLPRITPLRMLATALTQIRPNPILLALLTFFQISIGLLQILDPVTALERAGLISLSIALFSALGLLLAKSGSPHSGAVQVIAVLIGSLAGVVVVDLALGVIKNFDFFLSVAISFLLGVQAAVYVSLGTAIVVTQKVLNRELDYLQGSATFELDARRYVSGHANRNFAQYLHSEVQNKLLGIALAGRSGTLNNSDLLHQLNRLRTVIGDLHEKRVPVDDFSIRGVVDELREQWQGFVEISVEADLTLTLSTELQARALSEALNEAISNAVRHGHAKRIGIELAVSNCEQKLEVAVTDDGIGPTSGKVGLGTSLLALISREDWSLSQAKHGGARLYFSLPTGRSGEKGSDPT